MLKIGQIIKNENGVQKMLVGYDSVDNTYAVFSEGWYTEKQLKFAGYIIPPKEKWKPEVDEKMFFVNSCGVVDWYCFDDEDDSIQDLSKVGNCFQTKEEAQKVADKFKEMLKSL